MSAIGIMNSPIVRQGSNPSIPVEPDVSFTSANSFSLAENQTGVGTVIATPTGCVYSIVAGGDGSSFSIDPDTGILTFNSAPDFEVKSSYSLTVRATKGSKTDDQALTITITNVVENLLPTDAEVITALQSSLIGYYPASETGGSVLDDITPAGKDVNIYATVQYALPSGVDNIPMIKTAHTGCVDFYTGGVASGFNPSNFLINAWLTINQLETLGTKILFYYYKDSSNRIFIRYDGGSGLEYYYIAGGNVIVAYCDKIPANGLVNLGFSASGGMIAIWINGVIAARATGIGTYSGTPVDTGIFGNKSASNSFLDVSFFRLAIFNSVPDGAALRSTIGTKGLICFTGDSRMNGKQYLCTAANIQTDEFLFSRRGVVLDAVSGDSVAAINARFTATNANKIAGVQNILAVWIGVNSSGDTAETIFNSIKSYCLNAKSQGWEVLLCTEIDAQDALRVSNSWSTKYLALNTAIKNDPSFYNYLADLGANAELQNATNTTYFSTDKIHLTNAGYDKVAATIKAAIQYS